MGEQKIMTYPSHLKYKPKKSLWWRHELLPGKYQQYKLKRKKKINAIYPLCIFTANTIVDIVN